jgi:hypothetical protein
MQFYEEVARDCMVSQQSRKAQYARWKRYYMLGCSEMDNPSRTVNKIYPHVDQLTSFMYAQETTRFAVNLGVNVSSLELAKVPPLNQLINEEWHSSDTDITFGSALLWSWVYGTMLVKPAWKGTGISPGLVEPHNFGVLREDSPNLTTQEAFCHEYQITTSQLQNELTAAAHIQAISPERISEILAKVQPYTRSSTVDYGGPANIVVTSIQPLIAGNNMTGAIDQNVDMLADYRPVVGRPVARMQELYVWNDAEHCFQVVTLVDPYIPVWDRPLKGRMYPQGEIPFIQVCPSPAPDYFWGYSEVERLIPLQDLRNERMLQVRRLMDRQADPPWDFSGYTVTDEIMEAFNTPGGKIAGDMPNSKATPHQPDIPADLFNEINALDAMFEEMSGVNNVLSGRGETGVRSSGHASQLARLGSSRAKKRAMIVEDSLENLATLYLRLIQKYSKRSMRTEPIEQDDKAVEFIAAQFTEDFSVKVDGHSNSPIFMEDQKELVFNMLKAKMIDRESALELLDPSMKQLLRERLKRKIEPSEARQAAQQAQNEAKERSLKAVHGGKQ